MKDQERDDLFARARGSANPTDADRRRVRAAVARKLGVAAGASVGVTAAKAAASAAGTTAGASTTGLAGAGAVAGFSTLAAGKALALVVAVAAVGWAATPARHVAPVARASASVAVASAAPMTVTEALPRPREEPAQSDRAAAPTVVTPRVVSVPTARPTLSRPSTESPGERAPASLSETASETGTSPADDLALVKEMQIALRDGDDGRALALAREHERRFPASVLAPEREGVRALAVCSSMAPVDAQRVGQRFLDSHPLSPLAARVRSGCQLSR